VYPLLARLLAQSALQAFAVTGAPVFGRGIHNILGLYPEGASQGGSGMGVVSPVPDSAPSLDQTRTPPVSHPGFALGDYLRLRDQSTRTPWDISQFDTATPRRR
jgi:hypothetical protein